MFRKHWPALVLATAVGFTLILPAVSNKIRYGLDFNHPVNIRANDEFFYFARIREVIDGHPTIGNAYLAEHKSKPSAPLFLSEWLLAQPLKFLRMGVVAGDVLYDFFLPALATLLGYWCFFAVTRSRWLSLSFSAALFLGLFRTELGRAVFPQFVLTFWLGLFLWLYLLVEGRGKNRRLLIFSAAINFGLLFYLYPYYWTFYISLLSLFFIWLLLFRYFETAKILAAVAAGGLVIAVPYFLTAIRTARLPEYTTTLQRIGMIYTHFPSGWIILVTSLFFTAAGVCLILMKILPRDRVTFFMLGGLVTAAAVTNQHLITGVNFEFSSHYQLITLLWAAFFLAYIWRQLLIRYPAREKLLKYSAAAAAIVIVLWRLWPFNLAPAPSPDKIKSFGRGVEVMKWVEANTAKDEVIYAPSSLSSLLPIYTSANVYFSVPARLFFLSDEEVLDRFVIANFYRPQFNAEFVRGNMRLVYGVQFINTAAHHSRENIVRRLVGLPLKIVDPIPEQAVNRVLNRYREIRVIGFEPALKRYRADYVIWDKSEWREAPYDKLAFLERVGSINSFNIYRVR